jgi:RNA polymerase sigma-70 factor (ECF subfamily)
VEFSPTDITLALERYRRGDREALDGLLPVVYDELRRLAASALRDERPEHTLQPTALVHEAYLRMVGDAAVSWENRAQFFGFAAHVMRNVLVDHARARRRAKRGGGAVHVAFDEALGAPESRDAEVVALDEALTALAAFDAAKARIVELRYFGGLTIEETAEVLGVSPATVKREWTVARAWLHREAVRGGAS